MSASPYTKHPQRLRDEALALREALKHPREGWPPAEEQRLLERAQWFEELAEHVFALETKADLTESYIRSARESANEVVCRIDRALKEICP